MLFLHDSDAILFKTQIVLCPGYQMPRYLWASYAIYCSDMSGNGAVFWNFSWNFIIIKILFRLLLDQTNLNSALNFTDCNLFFLFYIYRVNFHCLAPIFIAMIRKRGRLNFAFFEGESLFLAIYHLLFIVEIC